MLSTHNMGGVSIQPDELRAMQANDYILHARDKKLEKVSVEKIRLPRDPEGHTQRLCLAQAPNGTIYAAQHTLLHKSTDGGKTWEHLRRDPDICSGWRVAFNDEGVMLNVKPPVNGTPPTVWESHDEGETWRQIGKIDVGTPDVLSLGFSMTRLDDGTLLVPVLVGADRIGNREAAEITPAVCRIYRSQDGGRTWSQYSVLGEWCCEVNVAQLPTGQTVGGDPLSAPKPARRSSGSVGADRCPRCRSHIPVQACVRRPFGQRRRYMDTAAATRHGAGSVLRIRRWSIGQSCGGSD